MLGISLIFFLVGSIATSTVFGLSAELIQKIKERNLNRTYGLVNGENTKIEKHPYQAALWVNTPTGDIFLQPGVILDKYWILTTPFITDDLDSFNVRVGETFLDHTTTGPWVEKAVYHPNYDYGLSYDFHLLKTTKPLKFSKKVKKIEIATESLEVGSTAVVTSWGDKKGLQEGSVTVSDNEECKKSYISAIVTDNTFCSPKDGTYPTDGDSGSPVVKDNKLYGIFQDTFDYYCLIEDCPALYNDVTKKEIRDWILETIKKG